MIGGCDKWRFMIGRWGIFLRFVLFSKEGTPMHAVTFVALHKHTRTTAERRGELIKGVCVQRENNRLS